MAKNIEDNKLDEAVQKFITEIGGNTADPAQVKAAQRYLDAQSKITKQGEEVGAKRQQAEQLAQQNQALMAQMAEAKKYVDWYNQNQQGLQTYAQWAQQVAAGQQPAAQAAAPASDTSLDLLTAQEREALVNEAVRQVREQALQPFQQQIAQALQQEAEMREKKIIDQLTQQQQAMSEVLVQSLGESLPKEQMAAYQKFQQAALNYADTSKLNPLELAKKELSTEMELNTREQKIKELEEKLAEKEAADSVFTQSTSVSSMFEEAPDHPKTEAERYQAVMKDVTNTLGADAVRSQFQYG